MKRIQRRDAIRNIKKRIASYLSVCLVIVLGIGGMLTTRYMEAGLDNTASRFYEDRKFKDFELISSLGVSDASIKTIESNEYVIGAEGVLSVEGSASFNGKKDNITVISLTKKVSVPEVTEGMAPSGDDECIIGEDFAESAGLKIGDKMSLSVSGLDMSSADALGGEQVFPDTEGATGERQSESENASDPEQSKDETAAEEGQTEDGDANAESNSDTAQGDNKASRSEDNQKKSSVLNEKQFTVTGLMKHPDYLRRNAANTVVLLPTAFNREVTKGLYTQAFVRIKQPEGVSPFSDKYFDKTESAKNSLEKLAEQLKEDRSREVKDEAYARIDKEWAEAKEKLEEAQAQIDSGETELNTRLADGENQLNDAERLLESTVDEYYRKLEKGEITVPEYNKTIKQLEKELKEAKEAVKMAEKILDKGFDWTGDILSEIDKVIEEKPSKDDPTTESEKKIADTVLENEAKFLMISEIDDKEARKAIKKLKQYSDKDLEKSYKAIKALDVDELIKESKKVKESAEKGSDGGTYHYDQKILVQLKAAVEAVEEFKEVVDEAKKKIDKAEKSLEKGKKKLRERIEAEAEKGRKRIAEGWSTYFSEKEKYETQLEEAKDTLAENKEKAEDKLDEVKTRVEAIKCEWIVLDRRGNAGYVDMRSNLTAINSMGLVFGLLFSIITAIVCFSTLVIMIDEQKTLVGTAKAFGFHKSEVLGKYLVFGLSSAVVGSILAAIAAYILTLAVQARLAASGMYSIGVAQSRIVVGPTILAAILIAAVTVAATVIACTDILRSPAALLMKGGVLKKDSKKNKKLRSSRKGSLYSKLIIRNILEDKARVLVSIAIIGFSCMLIGLGISMKAAFDGMVDKQISEVNRYDFRIDLNDECEEKDANALLDVMKKNNLSYMPASVETKMYVWDKKVDGLQMICADPDKIAEFFGVTDAETGKDIELPRDGVLIQKRMHESYGMSTGDKLPVLSDDLSIRDLKIKGYFVNYAGRAVVLTPEAYRKAFEKQPKNRSYFVKLNGKDRKDMEKQLLAVTDDISIAEDDEFKSKFESAMNLYNLLVLVTTSIAIFISFMILTNLANIYLARKKTELSVMRVNGFSIRQTKAYLVRESVITTIAGILLGVGVGALLTPLLIGTMQQPDLEFIKTFQPVAWLSAAGLEAAFAVLINYVVFRKVKDLNLRDIAG